MVGTTNGKADIRILRINGASADHNSMSTTGPMSMIGDNTAHKTMQFDNDGRPSTSFL